MAFPTPPYELNRNSISSGVYLAYHSDTLGDSGDPTPYDSYVTDNNQNPIRNHSWDYYSNAYHKHSTGRYHGIAYGDSSTSWSLIDSLWYTVTGNSSNRIVTNHVNSTTRIDFDSTSNGGNLYLSDNDTVLNVA